MAVDSPAPDRVRSVFLFLIISLLFAFLLQDLELGYYPERDSRVITVRIELKGAWQETIEEVITNPLEADFRTLRGVRRMVSRSEDEQSVITLFFQDSVDLDRVYLEVREIVDRAYRSFPAHTQKPGIMKSNMDSFPVFILMFEETEGYTEESLKRVFEGVGGTGLVEISGAPQQDLVLEADQGILTGFGIDGRSLAGQINASNRIFSIPLRTGLSLVTDNRYTGTDDFGRQSLGGGLRVGHLASPFLRDASVRSISKVDGTRKTVAWIRRAGDANTISLCRDLRAVRAGLPPSKVLYDRGRLIEGALGDILKAIGIGILAVMAATRLFIGNFRSAALLCLNIPFSVAGTLALMNLAGREIDILILSGIALGTGMVIDAGVVFLEAGPEEGRRPIFYSLVSTLLVFASLVFAPPSVRESYAGMVWSVSLCLILSVFYILVLLPGFTGPPRRPDAAGPAVTGRIFGHITRYRLIYAAGLLLVTGLCLWAAGDLRFQQHFVLEDDTLSFSVEFPSGTVKEAVLEVLRPLEEELVRWEETEFFTSDYRDEKGAFNLKLTPAGRERREELKDRIRRELAGRPGFLYFPEKREDRDYLIRVLGHDRELLYGSARDLVELFGAGGLSGGIIRHYKDSLPSLRIRLEPENLSRLGVLPDEVYSLVHRQLSRPVSGKWIPPEPVREGQKVYDVRLYDPAFLHPDLKRLQSLLIPLGEGRAVPLESAARFGRQDNFGRITHYDSLRGVSFSLTGVRASGRERIRLAGEILRGADLPEGIRVIHGEEERERRQYSRRILLCMGLSLVLILLLLIFLFESLSLPLFLFLQLPAALILPAGILSLLEIPVSAPVFFALILIAGISVNNGIVVFSPLKSRRPGREEVIRAFGQRSGSLVTAAVTTVAGLVPLLFSPSGLEGILPAVSLTVCAGLISSLVILLILSPLVFRK